MTFPKGGFYEAERIQVETSACKGADIKIKGLYFDSMTLFYFFAALGIPYSTQAPVWSLTNGNR